ncbi:MAG: hypothetical protein R2822_14995 [Spirosomataceae bacterium]
METLSLKIEQVFLFPSQSPPHGKLILIIEDKTASFGWVQEIIPSFMMAKYSPLSPTVIIFTNIRTTSSGIPAAISGWAVKAVFGVMMASH